MAVFPKINLYLVAVPLQKKTTNLPNEIHKVRPTVVETDTITHMFPYSLKLMK